ncbi:hypothetical protein PG994_012758 [Apiospora phragmitis]|uniref:Uncharacterized protein n=1 Tax=Apiospora phragmitis TaxID=2905665 RepID=A0ABR1TBD9_9PEZI
MQYSRCGSSRLALLWLLLYLAPVAIASENTNKFQSWFPQFRLTFETLLENECSEPYKKYRAGIKDYNNIDWMEGGSADSAVRPNFIALPGIPILTFLLFPQLTQPVVGCLLENKSEFIKAKMSTASVLLGLTPTILVFLGSNTSELAMVAVVGRRPLLALLLALGSPSVWMGRAFEIPEDPLESLRKKERQLHYAAPVGRTRMMINALEYLLAIASVVNIAMLDWELGSKAVCTFMPESSLFAMLWGLLVIPIHGLGVVLLRSQVQRPKKPDEEGLEQQQGQVRLVAWLSKLPANMFAYARRQIQVPSTLQALQVEVSPKRKREIFCSWILSTSVLVHIIFGTLVLSGILFVGTRDAFQVVARFAVSVLACRSIMLFEISVMRQAFNMEHGSVVS